MKISNRLATIASFIKNNSFVMDVGADHGLLELFLLENKSLKGIIAVENKVGPYSILKEALKETDVKCLLSDGINDIEPKVDCVVLAGMGGNLIVDILKRDKSKLLNVKQIVVDAHKDIELVRREIVKLGFAIEQERIVYDNKKYYFVISFLKGEGEYSQEEYEIGYKLKSDLLFIDYQVHEIARLKSDLEKAQSATKKNDEKIRNLEAKIRRLMNYGNN